MSRTRAITGFGALFLNLAAAFSAMGTPQEVARQMFPKTVMITTLGRGGRQLAIGSGFVLGPGQVVTNEHVIQDAASGFVKIVGDKTKYKISGVAALDGLHDLVILAVDGLSVDGAPLSQRATVDVGETVFAIGNPRGLEGTFSQGIVSSLRTLDDFTLLQITAPISPGSSGGPIVDEKGEIIGVAVATYRSGQNLNFAVPSRYVAELTGHIGKTVPLSENKPSAGNNALFRKLDASNSTEGVTVGNFLWRKQYPYEDDEWVFTISVKNNMQSPVSNVLLLVIFYDEAGAVVDFSSVECHDAIPAGLAKRVTGMADKSTIRLTTTMRIDAIGMPHHADKPRTKIEYRVLDFQID